MHQISQRLSQISKFDRKTDFSLYCLNQIDPTNRVLSTTEIPPQQSAWIYKEVSDQVNTRLSKLPTELRGEIFEWTDKASRIQSKAQDQEPNSDVKTSELAPYMSHEEALEIRLELMEERSALHQEVEDKFKDTWNFCEH